MATSRSSEGTNRNSPARSTIPTALIGGAAVFLAVIVYLVAAPLMRQDVMTFEPSVPERMPPDSDTLVVDTVTVDAADVETWRFFNFARGVVFPPDTNGWDLAFRRFHVVTSGIVADLGAVAFDEVTRAPDTGYTRSAFGPDTLNPALRRWYRYNVFSHQLKPAARVYVIRTVEGQYAKLEFLSYYCPGPRPGCVTFRYVYQTQRNRQLR